MTRRRIMLVEVEPKVPQPPLYRAIDPADHAPATTLSGNNLTLSVSPGDSFAWNGARVVGRIYAGQWYFESVTTRSASADSVIGITEGTFLGDPAILQTRPGFDSSSATAAGPDRLGNCYGAGGTLFANTGAVASGVILRHWIDMDSRIYRVAVGAGPWTIVNKHSSFGDYWHWPTAYAASGVSILIALNCPAGNSVSTTLNLGATPFVYDVPPGANAGIFDAQDPVIAALNFSSAPFSRVDKGEGIQYSARIVGDVESARAGSCWVWGGQTESRRGSIQLVNVEGDLDHLAHWHWRDAPVRILQGYEGDAYGDFTVWAACVADNLVFTARAPRRAELVLADALAAADEPIQQETYPEDHPITADAGKPIPLVFGIPFGCTGALQSPLTVGADAFAWQIHDGLAPTLAGLGTIYDNGIDITGRCVQWPASAPYKGFRVTGMAPIGKITVDASGNASTTIQTIVQNAFARLPPGKLDPMPTITLQPGGVAGLDSWAGIYIREPRTILQVMREAMDSVCGWACPTRDGSQLRLARVREPNGETPALVLTRAQVVGELTVELDTARNLTTRLAGRRNYTPHSHSEIAASISDPNSPTFNANRVAELTAEWRVIREGTPQIVGGASLSDAYAQARTAAHRGTLMQQQHHIQAEANRVCTTWYPTRHFVRLTALLDAVAADTLEPGDFVQLVWPGYGLDAGAMFMVVSVRSRFFSRRVDLTLWGSLPQEA